MLKVVFLVDMNAFFITCEMSRNPALADQPAAVAGNPEKRAGIILAANYPARSFGVKTTMTTALAKKLCPDLVLVPPDHRYYSKMSGEMMQLLSNYSPCIEKNSIDEAWLDMTGTEKMFGPPVKAAQLIMDDLNRELSLWCSIGIAENKFLAKMASDMKKPMGITELWKPDIPEKLWPLPVRAMHGIGDKTHDKLKRLNIYTIRDLAHADPSALVRWLGDSAVSLHQKANGQDTSPITPSVQGDVKSIGRSTTLPEDVYSPAAVRLIMMELAEKVGQTARKYSKKGAVIQITLKFSDFKVITRQTTVAPTYFSKDIFSAGMDLLNRNWPAGKAVRLVGISLSGFNRQAEYRQLSLFDLQSDAQQKKNEKTDRQDQQSRKLDEVMDDIRNKYGVDTIGRASLLRKK